MAALQNGATTLLDPRSRRISGNESPIAEAGKRPAHAVSLVCKSSTNKTSIPNAGRIFRSSRSHAVVEAFVFEGRGGVPGVAEGRGGGSLPEARASRARRRLASSRAVNWRSRKSERRKSSARQGPFWELQSWQQETRLR